MDALWPLASFAFVSSITPGPNNLMLSASGIAFGMQRTVPHMLGVVFGFMLLLAICGSGVGALVVEYPAAELAIKVAGSAYLMYLTWVMRRAFDVGEARADARPLTFVQAFLFQFANPKAWIMGLTASAVFMPQLGADAGALVALCAVFSLVGTPCIVAWAALGASVRRHLARPRVRTACGVGLVVLMGITIVAIWL
jgi:threonine/homoserine/homoserine lactone efflux protein